MVYRGPIASQDFQYNCCPAFEVWAWLQWKFAYLLTWTFSEVGCLFVLHLSIAFPYLRLVLEMSNSYPFHSSDMCIPRSPHICFPMQILGVKKGLFPWTYSVAGIMRESRETWMFRTDGLKAGRWLFVPWLMFFRASKLWVLLPDSFAVPSDPCPILAIA